MPYRSLASPTSAAVASNANDEHEQEQEQLELQSFFPHTTTSFDPNELSLPLQSIHPPWKRHLHELLEHPNASQPAFVLHILITALILLSAGVTILETIPFFHETAPSVWFGIETGFVVLFTVEYVARAISWSARWSLLFGWMTSFFGIIDLLAILPYYIEILIGVDTSAMFRFSILRTFRLLRVFRAFRSNNTILLTIEVMYLSVKRSQHALLALGFFLLMFLVIFSTIIYFAERGTWDPIIGTFIDGEGEPSQFSSIPAAAWFVLVTITTVGYGEITPRSFLGRLLTVPLLVCGLLLIALPSFVLGREFSVVWEMMGGNQDRVEGKGSESVEVSVERFDMFGQDLGANRKGGLSERSGASLSRRVIDLQGAVDAQGVLLRRLVDALEGTGVVSSVSSQSSYTHDPSPLQSRNRRRMRLNENGSALGNGDASLVWAAEGIDDEEYEDGKGKERKGLEEEDVVGAFVDREAARKGKGRAAAGTLL